MSAWRTCRFGAVLLSCASTSAFAATIVVDPSGGGAFTAIQPALDAALDGDTVLVQPGEYVIAEPIDFNRLHDPGDPGSPPVKDLILRSEGGAAVTTIRMAEEPADPNRASVMVFENGETAASALEGFTVTGGNGSSISPSGAEPYYGGGILLCNGSAPIVRGCVIDDNEAGDVIYIWFGDHGDFDLYELAGMGGGIAAFDATVTLIGCTVSNNGAQYSGSLYDSGCGGGIYAEGGSVTIVDCDISRNGTLGAPSLIDEWGDGGGVYCVGGTVNVHRTTVRDNDGGDRGGGLLLVRCQSTVFACEIEGNYVDTYGGDGAGINVGGGSLTLVHSRVAENYGGGNGGIYLHGAATAWIGQSEVTRNECWYGVSGVILGGATLVCEDSCISEQDVGELADACAFAAWGGSQVRLRRCTLAGNREAAVSGDATSSFELESCIVWGGGGPLVGPESEASVTAAYSDIEGAAVFPGTGNILADPLFVGTGDYHLQAGSPCVDAADPASAPTFDLEGWSRPCGAGVDMGAYERGECRGTLVLDDGDPGTYAVGRWLPSGGTPAWGEGCVYGFEDGSSYTFDFAVPGAGTWAVELWWTTWPSRLTEVPVEIEHAGETSTVLVDQQEDGGAWNRLGAFTFDGRAVVRILAAAGGSTCADAVRLVGVAEPPAPPPPPPPAGGGGSSGCRAGANAPGPESAAPYAFLVALILLLRAGVLSRSRGRS